MDLFRPNYEHGTINGYSYFCPGCFCDHFINVAHPNSLGAKWSVTGPLSSPTVSPSIHVFYTDAKGNRNTQCHHHVRDGKIQFLNDCMHDLRGQTIPLEPYI